MLEKGGAAPPPFFYLAKSEFQGELEDERVLRNADGLDGEIVHFFSERDAGLFGFQGAFEIGREVVDKDARDGFGQGFADGAGVHAVAAIAGYLDVAEAEDAFVGVGGHADYDVEGIAQADAAAEDVEGRAAAEFGADDEAAIGFADAGIFQVGEAATLRFAAFDVFAALFGEDLGGDYFLQDAEGEVEFNLGEGGQSGKQEEQRFHAMGSMGNMGRRRY